MTASPLPEPDLWDQVQKELHSNLSKPTFETWIRPVRCLAATGDTLQLEAPNPFASGWLQRNYLGLITELASAHGGRAVQVIITSANDPGGSPPLPAPSNYQPSNTQPQTPTPATRLRANLNPRYTFQRFVVGPNSRMAHAAALAVAESPGREFNPFSCVVVWA